MNQEDPSFTKIKITYVLLIVMRLPAPTATIAQQQSRVVVFMTSFALQLFILLG